MKEWEIHEFSEWEYSIEKTICSNEESLKDLFLDHNTEISVKLQNIVFYLRDSMRNLLLLEKLRVDRNSYF
jgi:hypothetical protein